MMKGALNTNDTGPDELFRKYDVEGVRAVLQAIQTQKQEMQQKLQTLLGDRYRDLIQSSDLIIEMGKNQLEKEGKEREKKEREQTAAQPKEKIEAGSPKRNPQSQAEALLSYASSAPALMGTCLDFGWHYQAAIVFGVASAALSDPKVSQLPLVGQKRKLLRNSLEVLKSRGSEVLSVESLITVSTLGGMTLLEAAKLYLENQAGVARDQFADTKESSDWETALAVIKPLEEASDCVESLFRHLPSPPATPPLLNHPLLMNFGPASATLLKFTKKVDLIYQEGLRAHAPPTLQQVQGLCATWLNDNLHRLVDQRVEEMLQRRVEPLWESIRDREYLRGNQREVGEVYGRLARDVHAILSSPEIGGRTSGQYKFDGKKWVNETKRLFEGLRDRLMDIHKPWIDDLAKRTVELFKQDLESEVWGPETKFERVCCDSLERVQNDKSTSGSAWTLPVCPRAGVLKILLDMYQEVYELDSPYLRSSLTKTLHKELIQGGIFLNYEKLLKDQPGPFSGSNSTGGLQVIFELRFLAAVMGLAPPTETFAQRPIAIAPPEEGELRRVLEQYENLQDKILYTPKRAKLGELGTRYLDSVKTLIPLELNA